MTGLYTDKYLYTEKEKDGEEYLVNMTDKVIGELVYEKDHLVIAYNYYNGIRDEEQFRYLEENYGIGNPTAVEFTPLIRRHVDALIGEHLQNKIKPKITCKDKSTLGKIAKLKEKAVRAAELNTLQSQFHKNFNHSFQPEEEKQQAQIPADTASESDIENVKEFTAKTFLSEYEIAAQHVLTHLLQSRQCSLQEKRKLLMLDLLIAGQCYYKVKVRNKGETPKIEVKNVFDTFCDKPRNQTFVNKSVRNVCREWLHVEDIINQYGKDLDADDIDRLRDGSSYKDNYNHRFVRSEGQMGLLANVGISVDQDWNYNDDQKNRYNLIPVYEVEWLSPNKVEIDGETHYRMDLYKSTRIGGDIYVDMGRVEDVVRSAEAPLECTTSLNGVFYSDRNGKPYSLVLATTKLQDKYDLLHFHRDTLIANSGVKGDWVDLSTLPTALGATPAERLMKFKAYKKQGLAPFNTAQEGRGANHNTTFGGYDDSVSGEAIQAIQFAIQSTEDTCSGITGVFRERLGNIEQRDAVTNVEVGIQTSATITKQYYQMMDLITTELLTDAINAAKISYSQGMTGSIIMGDRMQKIFTISPKHFSFTDYDIHIGDSSEIIRDMQDIKMLTMELIKAGAAEIDIVLEAITTESLTEMKETVLKAYSKKKEESNQVQQLTQQLQQAQQQMQEMQKQAQGVQSENEQLKAKNTALDEKKVEYEYDVKKEANRNTSGFNNQKIELDKSRIELEKLQLFDENKDNDEIKNE